VLVLVALTCLAVAGLLLAEYRDSRPGVWLAKPLASTGFVAVALVAGALGSDYGRWVLAALLLCWLGDVLLIPRGAPRCFRAGLFSFLLGHLAFAGAFVARGLDGLTTVGVAGAAAAVAWLVLRWLRPHLPRDMAAPVHAYVVVISAMLVCAAGTVGRAGVPRILVGALMFYVSDLAVARDRFLAPNFANKTWGLSLYFGGQLLLATTVSG
jgi:uncharacterized membrane protein YhhN